MAYCCVYIDANVALETYGNSQGKFIVANHRKSIEAINSGGIWKGQVYVIAADNLDKAYVTANKFLNNTHVKNGSRSVPIPIRGCAVMPVIIPYETMISALKYFSSRTELYIMGNGIERPIIIKSSKNIREMQVISGSIARWSGPEASAHYTGQVVRYYVACTDPEEAIKNCFGYIKTQHCIQFVVTKLPLKLIKGLNQLMVVYSTAIDMCDETSIFDTHVSRYVNSLYEMGLAKGKLLVISPDLKKYFKELGTIFVSEALIDHQLVYTVNRSIKESTPTLTPSPTPIQIPLFTTVESKPTDDTRASSEVVARLDQINNKLDLVLSTCLPGDGPVTSTCVSAPSLIKGSEAPKLFKASDLAPKLLNHV